MEELRRGTQTEGEAYAMRFRVHDHPQNPDLREEYAELLALAGDFEEAAAQVDTLVLLGEPSSRPAFELERSVLWLKAGRVAEAAGALRDWLAAHTGHPLRSEATYHLARALAADGAAPEARELYKLARGLSPDSWIARASKAGLERLGS